MTATLGGAANADTPGDGDAVRDDFVCRIDALIVGDRVLTPAHRWETVVGLERGDRYSRSTRVATDATGPEWPYERVNQHRVPVRRA